MAVTGSKGKSWSGIIVLFVVFGGLIWLMLAVGEANQRETVSREEFPNPSVENSRASGSKGFFEWTKVLGYEPKTLTSGYVSLAESASVLVIIAPNMSHVDPFNIGAHMDPDTDTSAEDKNPVTVSDGIAVRNWVESGHTLLLFASSLPGSTIGALHFYDKSYEQSHSPTTFAEAIGVYPQSAIQTDDKRRDYVPAQPSIWTTGVDYIHIRPGYRLYDPGNHGQTLFSDIIRRNPSITTGSTSVHAFPIAEVYRLGKGRVVAVSDDFFVCNRNIVAGSNATFLYNILNTCAHKGDTILFDEFHHTIGITSPSLWIAIGKPAQYATLQLLLVLFVALIVLAPRLGQPVPVSSGPARTSAEYVASLAGLYQSAGVTTTALETVYRQFLREICQKFGISTESTLDKMAEVVSRRGGVDIVGLRKLLVACEKALAAKAAMNGRDLVLLVRAIERFRKELGIG